MALPTTAPSGELVFHPSTNAIFDRRLSMDRLSAGFFFLSAPLGPLLVLPTASSRALKLLDEPLVCNVAADSKTRSAHFTHDSIFLVGVCVRQDDRGHSAIISAARPVSPHLFSFFWDCMWCSWLEWQHEI